jgi:Dihydrofolate reductase
VLSLQVYQEALQSADCSVVHLTQIEGEYPCDTFFPPLDSAQYRLWSASAPQRHKDDRYSFLCYTRAGPAGGAAPQLPPGLASRHEELQVRSNCADVRCIRAKSGRTASTAVANTRRAATGGCP